MKNIGFVILNYNDAVTTMRLVDSIEKWECKKFDMHIVVVDNLSKDDSFIILNEKYRNNKRIDVIQSERNGGYSYGNNFGIRYAISNYKSDYIAVANPDILIDENTIVELLNTFDYDSGIAMAAPVAKDLNGNYSISMQRLPEFKDDLRACFNSNLTDTLSDDCMKYYDENHTMLETELIVGCFFVIKTSVLENIGMFDENTFLFCEERILGKKLKEAGFGLTIRTDLFFTHAHSVSIKKAYNVVNTWKIIMNSRYYYEKTYNKCNLIQLLVLKICMECFIIGLSIKLWIHSLLERKKKCLN